MKKQENSSKYHRWPKMSKLARIITSALLIWTFVVYPVEPGFAGIDHSMNTETTDFFVGIGADVTSLDPALATDTNSLLVAYQIYDTLVNYELGGSSIEPGLAESWTVSSDGLVWTFNLRSGLLFHDGSNLDADAVVYNFERWWDPSHPAHDENFSYFLTFFGGFLGDPNCLITDITATTNLQIQIAFSQPFYHLLSQIALPAFSIASPTAIASGSLSTHPVGSGPFKFLEWVSNDSITLEANLSYWNGAPGLDSLTFQVIADNTERYNALQTGNVHSVGDLPNDYALLSATNPELQLSWYPSTGVGYLGINGSHTPFDNLLVRQAIAHAIDWQNLLSDHYTYGDLLANQFLPSGIWGYNPTLSAYTYDPTLAVTLLTAAGYSSGFSTTLAYRSVYRQYLPNPAATAVAIKSYLDAIGIQTTVIEYESGTFIGKVYNGDLDLFLLGWYADYPHPDNFYAYHFCSGERSLGPEDSLLCTAIEQALSETDSSLQMSDYYSIAEYIHNSVPLVSIVHPRTALLIHKTVTGLVASPMGLEEYRNADFVESTQEIALPNVETTLLFTDAQNELTTIQIPEGAVTDPTLIRYEPLSPASIPTDLGSANHAFELSALRDGEILPDFNFELPISFTIEYSDLDILQLYEETIRLYYWDGSSWIDVASTCDPISIYNLDLIDNQISVDVCHLTPFSLFGELMESVFVPFVYK